MNLPDAARADPATANVQGMVRLDGWGLIRAHGADAASFLHGQLTQDVQRLGEASVHLAGYCSAKGRLLASGPLWRAGPDELLWACSADVLPATLKRLSMFVLRAKCKLGDATAELPLYGLVGAAAERWLGARAPAAAWRHDSAAGGRVLRLPDVLGSPRYLLALPAHCPAPSLEPLPPGAWEWFEASSGIARIVGATVEQFVPQMVNFEVAGGVNFQKGCYPGQEIVARSQYRGSVKRRAFVFDCDDAAWPGQEVFHSADPEQPAGMVVNAGSLAASHRALVEVKLAALDSASLHLGSVTGPALHRSAQPYPLPTDSAA